jgi:hypothetical protein
MWSVFGTEEAGGSVILWEQIGSLLLTSGICKSSLDEIPFGEESHLKRHFEEQRKIDLCGIQRNHKS